MTNPVVLARVALLALSLTLIGCASMKDSVKARKMLEKCSYELTEVQLDLVDFESTISFDNESKKINVNDPGKETLSLIKEIKKGNFSLDLSQLRFNAIIKITNPNTSEVELDSLKLKTYLDDAFLVDVRHLEHTVIAPNSSVLTNVAIALPTAFPVKELFQAEDMVLKGKVWLNLMITKNNRITLPVPISVRKKIPREEINAAIQEEKDKKIKELLDYISKQGSNKLKKAIKNKF
ncbi:MAG: hypothetical protein ABJN36_17900 [Cyclobacteriaceae bacterium]